MPEPPVLEIQIPSSKSISNRLLVLQALFPDIRIDRLSVARDTVLLKKALEEKADIIDVQDAGTAMRFSLAYLAFHTHKPVLLTGTERMKQRPVGPLAEALRSLGAKIEYAETEGYPPLRVYPAVPKGNTVQIDERVSSQFITALMLIAPAMPEGLHIRFNTRRSVSKPYWKMTAMLLRDAGVDVNISDEGVLVKPLRTLKKKDFVVESDWSSASYFYEATAISGKPVFLRYFDENSLQGDSRIRNTFRVFGVKTTFMKGGILLEKNPHWWFHGCYLADCKPCPDLAQTIAVTCAALNVSCRLNGLKTLRIKETDRISAMHNELKKLGVEVRSGDYYLQIISAKNLDLHNKTIETYRDHRMNMAFAPLMLLHKELQISDPGNVDKSYPGFWEDWDRYLRYIDSFEE